MTTKTELQQNIKDAIQANPDSDDKEIARIVYSKNHPGEEYKKGSSPSPQYVAKIRGRISYESRAPEIEVTGEQIPEPPTTDAEPEPEEPPYTPESYTLPTEETPTKTTEPSLFEGEEIVRVGFDGVAAFTNWSGWKLDPKDATDKKFMQASARMMEKHAPGAISQFGDEIMFVVSAASSVGPRIRDYKKHLDSEKPIIPPLPSPIPTGPESKIPPTETPSPNPTETTKAIDEGPRSIGDDQFKRRLGGQLR